MSFESPDNLESPIAPEEKQPAEKEEKLEVYPELVEELKDPVVAERVAYSVKGLRDLSFELKKEVKKEFPEMKLDDPIPPYRDDGSWEKWFEAWYKLSDAEIYKHKARGYEAILAVDAKKIHEARSNGLDASEAKRDLYFDLADAYVGSFLTRASRFLFGGGPGRIVKPRLVGNPNKIARARGL